MESASGAGIPQGAVTDSTQRVFYGSLGTRKPLPSTEVRHSDAGNAVRATDTTNMVFPGRACNLLCCYGRPSRWLNSRLCNFVFLYRCRRREDTQCSPSEGPCCNNRCRFISKWEKIKCKGNQDCTKASFCDGNQAQCPIPAFKEDNVTECNEGTQVRMLEIFFTNKKNELNYVVVLW